MNISKTPTFFKIWFNFFLTCFSFLVLNSVSAQGRFFVRNFSPKEYKAYAQNWEVTQDERGIIYVANFDGVLEYDGVRWNLIPVGEELSVNALQGDKNGRIYVGASGDFGFLAPNAQGKMQYHSLSPLLSEKDLDFQEVFEVRVVEDGVIFNAYSHLFFYQPEKQAIQVWKEEDFYFYEPIAIDSQIYVVHLQKGLGKISQAKGFELLPKGDFCASQAAIALLPIQKQNNKQITQILVVTAKGGFWTYNLKSHQVEPFPISVALQKWLESYDLSDFKPISVPQIAPKEPEIHYLLTSHNGGAILIDAQGNILRRIDENSGLQTNMAFKLAPDNFGGIWFGMNQGISRAELLSPFEQWSEQDGLKDMVLSVVRYGGKIYAGTFAGLFVLEGNRFEPLGDIKRACWDLRVLKEGNTESLLIASSGGLFLLESIDNQAIEAKKQTSFRLELIREKSSYALWLSPKKDYFYVSGRKGVLRYDKIKEAKAETSAAQRWKLTRLADDLEADVRSLYEMPNGEIWVASAYNGFLKITFAAPNPASDTIQTQFRVQYYDTKKGLPSNNWVNVYPFLDKKTNQVRPIFTTGKGIYQYNAEKDRFEPDFAFDLPAQDVFRLVQTPKGELFLGGLTTKKGLIRKGTSQGQKWEWQDKIFRRLPEMGLEAIYADGDSLLWLGGSEGLFKYDLRRKGFEWQPFEAQIRKIVLSEKDSTIFYGAFFQKGQNDTTFRFIKAQPQDFVPILEYAHNSLLFYCASSYLEEPQTTLYSYFLEGFDEHWSAWTPLSQKEYTNLPEGSYLFQVRARNLYQTESQVATFAFEVLPPWYRTFWAYAAYFLFGVGFFYTILKINGLRLKKQNQYLEQKVQIRTQEIQKKNEQIQQKNTELEQQQEEIRVQAENLIELNEELRQQHKFLQDSLADIADKNKDITASINYARRIQQALLPSIEVFKQHLPQSFVFFQPKDIVSGDFYWLQERHNQLILVVADCTGHGVPGAFMSLIGMNLLHEIAILYQQPHLILDELHERLTLLLNKKNNAESRDGMDMGVCVWDRDLQRLSFAGAKFSLVMVAEGELSEIKGDIMPIGHLLHRENYHYTCKVIDLAAQNQQDTAFYLFSDGFQDQFGGEENKKFMKKRFKELLLKMNQNGIAIEEQQQALSQIFNNWRGEQPQIDDVLVVGFKPFRK
ncbi:triple tyrosine motif-containing protein [Hugenholtzia roseola]|uniref:triple tyrosine motif-containing protein n=1 Tax=Hugenholtzia roseola TaxID=1002 RepID=UPI00047D6D51|nr:triple tyrosine motif-containing protein [Hugenholtzia roseola]